MTSDHDAVWHWLYERAEDAATKGLPLNMALDAVRCGYSSIDADRMTAEDLRSIDDTPTQGESDARS